MTEFRITAEERSEMLRAHTGIVTASIGGDQSVLEDQIASVLRDIVDRSGGDQSWVLQRMAKQLEAGAIATRVALKMLASRDGITEEEANRRLAEVYIEATMPPADEA